MAVRYTLPSDPKRNRTCCRAWYTAVCPPPNRSRKRCCRWPQADRAVCRGRTGLQRHRPNAVCDRPQQSVHREPLRRRPRTDPRPHRHRKEHLLEGLDFETASKRSSSTRGSASRRPGRRHPLRRELRGRAALCGRAGRFHPRAWTRSRSRGAHDRTVRSATRQCVIAVEEVPSEEVSHYGIVQIADGGEPDMFRVLNLVEKPSPEECAEQPGNRGPLRVFADIFDMIRRVKPDKKRRNSVDRRHAAMCEEGSASLAVKLPPDEKRYDIGNFPSYFRNVRGICARGGTRSTAGNSALMLEETSRHQGANRRG